MLMPDIGSLLALLGLKSAGEDINLPSERKMDPRLKPYTVQGQQEALGQALQGYRTLSDVGNKYNTLNQPPQRK